MNIAFPALLILLLYLPGAIFLATYWGSFSRERDVPVISSSITRQAAYALLVAFLLNVFWAIAGYKIGPTDVQPNEAAFVQLLAGSSQSSSYATALDWFGHNLGWLSFYFISMYVVAMLLGLLLRFLVRKYELDLKIPGLKFSDSWRYVLKGENLPNRADIAVYVDLMVEIDKTAYLYSGLLADYWYDSSGDVDALMLTGATKLPASALTTTPTAIPGEYLIFRCKHVQNINVRYLR